MLSHDGGTPLESGEGIRRTLSVTGTSSRAGTIVVVVVVAALIAVMVVLHLTGVVGPSAH